MERDEPDLEVWRVEVRAGKKHLKDVYNIRTLDDFENSIGDTILNNLNHIRYVSEVQTDSNITRRTLHPIWQSALKAASGNLLEHQSGLTSDQIRHVDRTGTASRYEQQTIGNAIGLALSLGISSTNLDALHPDLIANRLRRIIRNDKTSFTNAANRAANRLHFKN